MVVVLQIVDSGVLGAGDVDAHCDCVCELVEGGEGRERRDVCSLFALDLATPVLELHVGRDGRVGGIRRTQHAGHETPEGEPDIFHVARVGVVVKFGGVEFGEGKAAGGEIVRDVAADEIEGFVLRTHHLETAFGGESVDVDDDLGDETCSCGGIEGEGFEPVGGEELEYGVCFREVAVGGDDDSFFDEMGVGEMGTQFVGVPVGYLGALLCVAPRPIGCFVGFRR